MKRTLTVGIASYEQIKAYTLAVARGSVKSSPSDPKVWFTSIESMAQILSSKNKMLIEIIAKECPASIEELAELSGRAKSNLSRTLHTMERYGLVKLNQGKRGRIEPRVTFSRLRLHWEIGERSVRLN